MAVDREALHLSLIEYTCGQRCLGIPGNKGGCCTVGSRDFIIGPIDDVEPFLERLRASGLPAERSRVFVDYEEGRKLFPNSACWQEPKNYPALRVVMDDPVRPCAFYDMAKASCSVYEARPDVCRRFACEPLRQLLSLV